MYASLCSINIISNERTNERTNGEGTKKNLIIEEHCRMNKRNKKKNSLNKDAWRKIIYSHLHKRSRACQTRTFD